jgi:hypothetical protein
MLFQVDVDCFGYPVTMFLSGVGGIAVHWHSHIEQDGAMARTATEPDNRGIHGDINEFWSQYEGTCYKL